MICVDGHVPGDARYGWAPSARPCGRTFIRSSQQSFAVASSRACCARRVKNAASRERIMLSVISRTRVSSTQPESRMVSAVAASVNLVRFEFKIGRR